MTYIDYLNDFNRWLESGNLPGGSQLMYFKLLNVFNRAGWPEYVQVDNDRTDLPCVGWWLRLSVPCFGRRWRRGLF